MGNMYAADKFFMDKTRKIFIDRTVAIETFEQYLNHRYRNNCYNYSASAIMGMSLDDYLVRGDITIYDSWQWENGGYDHGWVEFNFEGETYVFDSRVNGVTLKKEWYLKFKPKNIVKFTKREILNSILNSERVKVRKDGAYEVNDTISFDDKNNIQNPFSKSIIYMSGNDVEKFIAYRFFCN